MTNAPDHRHSPFGNDRFGRSAERFARFFGTPTFIVGQTVLICIWLIVNGVVPFASHVWNSLAHGAPFDPSPWILLNLFFSTQAAYAAPLILLAQTRQADRDKAKAETDRVAERQREEIIAKTEALAEQHAVALRENTVLTQQVATLVTESRK